MNIKDLVRKNILELVPYSAARHEFSGENAIFLDANENPYGEEFNRYPDPWQKKLKENIANVKGISQGQIFLGNGADEVIDLLTRGFCEPGVDGILITDPTFTMYEVSAKKNDNEVIKIPLNRDFSLNVSLLKGSIKQNTKLIYLCSPGNPTAKLLDKNAILEILQTFNGLVIIDEAYIDFSGDDGFLPFLKEFNNLVVVQTFSKAKALAGIRLGMAFADPEIINILNKIKLPYNISEPSQNIALKVFNSGARYEKMIRDILQQRNILEDFLSTYPFCEKVYPSDTNFLLVKFKESASVFQFLKINGVIVRDRSSETNCENCVRITIGTEKEIQTLINTLSRYEKETPVY